MRPYQSHLGFTLVELLITVAILAFSIAGILACYTTSSRMAESSRNLTMATSHASYVLEDIRNTLFANVATNIASGYWNLTSTQLNSRLLGPLNNESVTTTNLGGTNPIDVQVVVSWNDAQGRAKTLTLRTLVGG